MKEIAPAALSLSRRACCRIKPRVRESDNTGTFSRPSPRTSRSSGVAMFTGSRAVGPRRAYDVAMMRDSLLGLVLPIGGVK